MLETKEEKIKLGVGVGILVLAIVLIIWQFMPDGPPPGTVAGPDSSQYQPADAAPDAPPVQGGRRVAPGVNPSGS